MTKYIYPIAFIGALILIIPIFYLGYLNRGPKIYGSSLSILLGALTATIVTFMTVLKPTKIIERFPVSIALNRTTNLPFQPSLENFEATSLQSALAARANVEENGQQGMFIQRRVNFKTADDKTNFYLELLQYEMVKRISNILRADASIGIVTAGGHSIVNTQVLDTFRPDKFLKLSGFEVSENLSGNRFLNLTEKRFWNDAQSWLPIPFKTKFYIPDRRTIKIERPEYFNITLGIEPFGEAPGIPHHLANEITDPDIDTVSFIIKLEANFNKFTAESPYTEDNKKWANFLFTSLRNTMANQRVGQ